MKIEKINENKIRITFNNSYLTENNIDLHTFMSKSIESQNLFLNLLDKAEQEVGFITDNYKLSIEALALSNGNFIITVTRLNKEALKSTRVQAHRKTITNTQNIIYKFTTFDDFCNFENFISASIPNISLKSTKLYKYDNYFFLVLQNVNTKSTISLSTAIIEFATAVEYSDVIVNKFEEFGEMLRV